LNIPNLLIDKLSLSLDKLDVDISLNFQVAGVVKVNSGIKAATASKVNFATNDIKADAGLVVRLGNVAQIMGSALEMLDKNPDMMKGVMNGMGGLGPVTGVIKTHVDSTGQVVQILVDPAGNIIQQTLDTKGRIIHEITIGNVNAVEMRAASENGLGQWVEEVRNSDGSVYLVTYDKRGGSVVDFQVLSTGNTTVPIIS